MYAKNAWNKYEDNQYKDVMEFNEGYKSFITQGKTERACVKEAVALAQKAGFQDIQNLQSLKTGDKFYVINKDKNLALFVMGKKPLIDGMRILGAHIDSPRLDLKQNPLYESRWICFTRYTLLWWSEKISMGDNSFIIIWCCN